MEHRRRTEGVLLQQLALFDLKYHLSLNICQKHTGRWSQGQETNSDHQTAFVGKDGEKSSVRKTVSVKNQSVTLNHGDWVISALPSPGRFGRNSFILWSTSRLKQESDYGNPVNLGNRLCAGGAHLGKSWVEDFFFFSSCTKYLPSLAPNLFLMYVTTVGYYIFNNIFHL